MKRGQGGHEVQGGLAVEQSGAVECREAGASQNFIAVVLLSVEEAI